MTPRSILTLARSIVNDVESAYYRTSDVDLVSYVNDGLKEASRLVPHLFYQTGDLSCTVNQTEQAVTFSDAQTLVDVIRIKNGAAVHPMDMAVMSRFNPGWAADDAGPAKNWANNKSDPLRFYIYPKAPVEMQILEVLYVRNPATYTIDEDITEVPESIAPALAWYVIHMAEMKDDEHVSSGRAVAAYQMFVNQITGSQGAA